MRITDFLIGVFVVTVLSMMLTACGKTLPTGKAYGDTNPLPAYPPGMSVEDLMKQLQADAEKSRQLIGETDAYQKRIEDTLKNIDWSTVEWENPDKPWEEGPRPLIAAPPTTGSIPEEGMEVPGVTDIEDQLQNNIDEMQNLLQQPGLSLSEETRKAIEDAFAQAELEAMENAGKNPYDEGAQPLGGTIETDPGSVVHDNGDEEKESKKGTVEEAKTDEEAKGLIEKSDAKVIAHKKGAPWCGPCNNFNRDAEKIAEDNGYHIITTEASDRYGKDVPGVKPPSAFPETDVYVKNEETGENEYAGSFTGYTNQETFENDVDEVIKKHEEEKK